MSPVTSPDIVKVVVPPTSYQLFKPAKGLVTTPASASIVSPGSRSRTSTVVAPPPKVKVIVSIELPIQTT